MTEHEKRLARELRASRQLRCKSKATVTKRARVTSAIGHVSSNGTSRVCYVVRVKGLNKAGRKAFRHLLKRCGIAWVPCEYTRAPIKGACLKRLRGDTLASAYLCSGPRGSFRDVWSHSYVTGIERPGTCGNRLVNELGRKKVVRAGPKHKRPPGHKMFVKGPAWAEDDKGRPVVVTVWASEKL